MKTVDRLRVPPEQLRWSLDPRELGFASTEEVAPGTRTPGQNRAVRAMEVGLALRGHGFNIFVAGDSNTIRTTTVGDILDRYDDPSYTPEDFCFVNNFRDQDKPRLLRFPAGQGRRFHDAMEEAVQRLRDGIPNILQSEVFVKRRRARVQRYTQKLQDAAVPLKDKAEPEGLVLVQLEMEGHAEAELLPLIDGEPVAFEDLETKVEQGLVPRADLERLQAARIALEKDLRAFAEAGQRLVREAEKDLAELDRKMTRPFLNLVLSGVYQDFQDVAGVVDYLREMETFLESRIALFRAEEDDGDGEDTDDAADSLRVLQVNLILDNADQSRRPVIFENNPHAANLRGVVDREVRSTGQVISDFTHIKAGSMIRAHGGYLVLHADDFDGGGRAWGVIKRTLRTAEVQIEAEESVQGAVPRAPRPEPVPVDVKVILIGSVDLYHELLMADSDFPKVFKIKAEFDTEMELGPQAITEYACMVRRVCDREGHRHFSAAGVAAVVEHGVRLAGHRNRITTRFSQVADLVREAAYWAGRQHGELIGEQDVHRAVDERRNRVNLIEEKTQRLIREGVLLIDTEKAAVGQINGLAVIDVGDHRFGRPTRITASVAAGTRGVLNMERMANLSGSSHDKGLLILTGYLLERFAARHPLAMTAGITLEQSYDEVDGDSATIAEIYALLSALADAPARQDLAVTGSLNQKGQVQAVGGVNEKIEGFFDLCQARGLTGAQGVLIPAPNLPHLMLRPRVVSAVREGKFHIYALTEVAQGIELLTGVPAGEADAEGRFPEDSIFGRAQRRLEALTRASRDFLPWGGGGEGL